MINIETIQSILIVYTIVGTCILLMNVLLLGIMGDKWLKNDLLIILTWPLDIVNLLGILIGALVSAVIKFKNRKV